jgi:hypothetical protein
MSRRSPRVDGYIRKAPEFAQPILEKLRTIRHKASPDISENIKWGVPSFEYKGIVAGMAAFKNHVGFGFMKSPLMKDPHGILRGNACESIMPLKVRSLSELPTQKLLLSSIVQALELNEAGATVRRKERNWKYEGKVLGSLAHHQCRLRPGLPSRAQPPLMLLASF